MYYIICIIYMCVCVYVWVCVCVCVVFASVFLLVQGIERDRGFSSPASRSLPIRSQPCRVGGLFNFSAGPGNREGQGLLFAS